MGGNNQMTKFSIVLSSFISSEHIVEENGLAAICSYMRNYGYTVDMIMTNNTEDQYVEEVIKKLPDIIGFTIYSSTLQHINILAKKLKEKLPNVIICYGGAGATVHGEDILINEPSVDYIVIGEGEETFLELVSSLEKNESLEKIRGLCYRKDNEIISTSPRTLIKDINTLPYASRDTLSKHNLRMASLSTSRGCVRNCSFCLSHNKSEQGKRWRGRDCKSIVDEIEYIYKNYNKEMFIFADPSFEDPSLNRAKEIATEIIRRGLKIYYTVFFRGDVYRKVSHELIELLITSGLCSVFLGIEAANEADLILYNKQINVEDSYNSIEFFKNLDINTSLGFINFNPYSTFDSLKQNGKFLRENNFHSYSYFNSYLKAYKGTDIYNRIKTDNLLINDEIGISASKNYRFVDDRIEFLFEFINSFFNDSGFDKHNHYFSVMLPHLLSFLKRKVADDKNISLLDEIRFEENQIESLLNETYQMLWYEQLIEMAQNRFDKDQAQTLMNKLFDKGEVMEKYKVLQGLRSKMYKRIAKEKIEYLKYL